MTPAAHDLLVFGTLGGLGIGAVLSFGVALIAKGQGHYTPHHAASPIEITGGTYSGSSIGSMSLEDEIAWAQGMADPMERIRAEDRGWMIRATITADDAWFASLHDDGTRPRGMREPEDLGPGAGSVSADSVRLQQPSGQQRGPSCEGG